ncbi:MAG: hypothetical protein WDW38_011196 [Sanguina aurantia]
MGTLFGIGHQSHRASLRRRCRADTGRAASEPTSLDPAAAEPQVAWDPDGVLASAPPVPAFTGSLIERKLKERAARLAQQQQQQQGSAVSLSSELTQQGQSDAVPTSLASSCGPILHLSQQQRDAGGVPVAGLLPGQLTGLRTRLRQRFMHIDLAAPGLLVQCLDPPVFTVEALLQPAVCAEIVEACSSTGLMRTSRIGAGNASDASTSTTAGPTPTIQLSSRRTSTSMMLDAVARAVEPRLPAAISTFHQTAKRLLDPDHLGVGWGSEGRLPSAGQFCLESLQVACYTTGQHFLEHEDAFPLSLTRTTRFQRHATLLVYLNGVPAGGATSFQALGLSIAPVSDERCCSFLRLLMARQMTGRSTRRRTRLIPNGSCSSGWLAAAAHLSPASQTALAHSTASQGTAATLAQTVTTASSAPKKAGGFGGSSGPTLKKASRKKT